MLFSSSDVIRHFPMRDFNGYLLSGSTSLCSWSWPWASTWPCWWRAARFKGQSPRGLLWLRSLSKSCAKCRSRASPPHLCILLLFQTFMAWTPQDAYLYLGLKNKEFWIWLDYAPPSAGLVQHFTGAVLSLSEQTSPCMNCSQCSPPFMLHALLWFCGMILARNF